MMHAPINTYLRGITLYSQGNLLFPFFTISYIIRKLYMVIICVNSHEHFLIIIFVFIIYNIN